jgi:hypothetical protein
MRVRPFSTYARARCLRRFAASFAFRRADRSAVRGCRFCAFFMLANLSNVALNV